MSGGWVHSVLRARARVSIYAPFKIEQDFEQFISPIPTTTATKAGSPVSDDLQHIVNATLNLRACPKFTPPVTPKPAGCLLFSRQRSAISFQLLASLTERFTSSPNSQKK